MVVVTFCSSVCRLIVELTTEIRVLRTRTDNRRYFRLHQMHKIHTAVTDDRTVCQSVCQSVCKSACNAVELGFTVQEWLNERIKMLSEMTTRGGPWNTVL